jgi:hypothetical protein
MLTIVVSGEEMFDNEKSKFVRTMDDQVLELEHSLVSLSKWESKYEKPFLAAGEKTPDQILSYIHFMVISPGVSPEILSHLDQENLHQINAYIESKQSATTFGIMPDRKGRGETVTSELIYYWMTAFEIPWEAQHWHLNRLFSLIRICNVKQQKPKKMSRSEIAARNRELNAQRRAELGTKG